MITETEFGRLPDARPVHLFELRNAGGLEIRITNFGGIVVALRVPDRHGAMADVVLGFDDLASYVAQTVYFGATIGRHGSRIARARFRLDGRTYRLSANEGDSHLHGGRLGFDKVLWTAHADSGATSLVLEYESVDGEEGYPGNLRTQVGYRLTDDNEMIVDYRATTDKATPVNLTHHSYFNLSGSRDILDHELTIHADRFLPVGDDLIPTGELRPVADTAFDFTSPRAIGARIEDADPQLVRCGGYDHNFALSRTGTGGTAGEPGARHLVAAARVVEPRTGRTLELETTEPGVLFYSGNFLGPGLAGKAGSVYGKRAGFCLETQHFTDSPNQPTFPTTILRPGQRYRSRTVYRFGIEEGAGPPPR